MKKTNKTYYIVMTSKITFEKSIFGEITIKPGDVYFVKLKLNNENNNHSFEILDKKYCKDNNINPLD